MTKPIDEMEEHELIWKAEGEVMSAIRIADQGNDPRKALGFALSALKRYREKTGI